MMMQQILSGARVLLGNDFVSGKAVVIEGRQIHAIVDDNMLDQFAQASHIKLDNECYLVPGFIDCHIHGAAGHDVMDASHDALKNIAHQLVQEGVTGFLATTMTADIKHIETVLSMVANYRDDHGAKLLGVHLEGPFISGEKMGAQLGDKTLAANAELFMHWQTLSHNQIKLVTMAPELAGANEFIRMAIETGAKVALGHSNATYETAMHAITHGVSHATHLFNAMRSIHHREPGVATAALLSRDVFAELIADGEHLHAAMCELALHVKGAEKLLLVTDAMRAKCLGNGCYDLGGQTVTVKDGRAALDDGTLAGSVLTMPRAIFNMQTYSGCTLAQAVNMASLNPARQLGLDHCKGKIAAGYDADLVVMSPDGDVLTTLVAGEVAFNRAVVV